jgi:hypothetical protein
MEVVDMKSLKLAVLAISLVGVLGVGVFGVGNAMAANSTNLTVSATVDPVCSISGVAPTMAFSNIDPTSTTVTDTASASVSFTCTNGTNWSVTDILGDRYFTTTKPASATDTSLGFTIALDTTVSPLLTGTGTGALQTVKFDGTITPTQKENAPTGEYTEIIVVNITPGL